MGQNIRRKKFIYNYLETGPSEGVRLSVVFLVLSILFLLISILISFIFSGEAPAIVAGIGISSLIFNLASMISIILEVYLFDNYKKEIRNLLLLQLVLFAIWIFII